MELVFLAKIFATVIFGIVIGLISSIPVGAIQLEVIKKAINGHTKPALATAAGSATSDLIYGLLALFGFGHFLLGKQFQIIIYALGIVVLSFLIYRAFKEREYMLHEEQQITYKKRLSFLTGFTIAITNPSMVIWWFIGYKLYLDLNLFAVMTPLIKFVFVLSGALGLGAYLALEALILHRYQKSFSDRFLYKANIFLMVVLSILIVYFSVQLFGLLSGYKTPGITG